MTNEQKNNILSYLDAHYPSVGCELTYQKDYELLIAVVLSAQTTDQAVNKVTPVLFSTFPTLHDLAHATLSAIESCIQSIGLYHAKASHIRGIAHTLLNDHAGRVPSDKDALLKLPGVGVKTANVVRAELFRIPEIAVDTHVHRLAYRLGFRRLNDDVIVTEAKLRKALPSSRYILFHHQLIHFGRYACKAKKPACRTCGLMNLCKEKQKNLKEE
jgi:endonuclease III